MELGAGIVFELFDGFVGALRIVLVELFYCAVVWCVAVEMVAYLFVDAAFVIVCGWLENVMLVV